VCLDSNDIGGQAGSSARIENYAGFPNGISGSDLTARAAVQAMRLGARLNAPCDVVALRHEPSFHVVALRDGSEIPARSVIVASGARYRRLSVDDLERFEGAGVYYAATELEARVCDGMSVIVIGGGNSAGQAALFLAQNRCDVVIAVRRPGLRETMSAYLVDRIDADPRIELVTGWEVAGLAGAEHLERVTLREVAGDSERTVPCAGLFCFIGATPATGWLDESVALDDDGFVLTDRQLLGRPGVGAASALPFETSVPGVFAAGDVRHGSMKRVAAAVGEGSSAVRSVHERLATLSE
jgi:thioredoxin reductase (NADPH)